MRKPRFALVMVSRLPETEKEGPRSVEWDVGLTEATSNARRLSVDCPKANKEKSSKDPPNRLIVRDTSLAGIIVPPG